MFARYRADVTGVALVGRFRGRSEQHAKKAALLNTERGQRANVGGRHAGRTNACGDEERSKRRCGTSQAPNSKSLTVPGTRYRWSTYGAKKWSQKIQFTSRIAEKRRAVKSLAADRFPARLLPAQSLPVLLCLPRSILPAHPPLARARLTRPPIALWSYRPALQPRGAAPGLG